MGRIVAGVIVGYLTMFVAVFVLFSVAWLVMGADGAFQPNSWDPSGLWILSSIVVGLAAGVGGGCVCAAIARDPKGTTALVVVVLVLGLLLALPVIMGSAEAAAGVRPETVGMFEAMQNARQPTWIALLNPLLGAVGVLIGAKLHRPATA